MTTYWGTLTPVECCNCHMIFGMPPELNEKLRKDRESFYCPAGHKQRYTGESEEEKLRRENQRLVQNQAYLHDRIKQESDRKEHERNSHRATRGHLTRIRKRAANGVCPCCNRTFGNLARHMTTQHPDFEKVKA